MATLAETLTELAPALHREQSDRCKVLGLHLRARAGQTTLTAAERDELSAIVRENTELLWRRVSELRGLAAGQPPAIAAKLLAAAVRLETGGDPTAELCDAAALASAEVLPKAAQSNELAPPKSDEAARELRQWVAASDADTQRILEIANRKGKGWDAEKKLRAIADIDRRFQGFDSEALGNLVGVSGARIRQLDIWGEWQNGKKNLD